MDPAACRVLGPGSTANIVPEVEISSLSIVLNLYLIKHNTNNIIEHDPPHGARLRGVLVILKLVFLMTNYDPTYSYDVKSSIRA